MSSDEATKAVKLEINIETLPSLVCLLSIGLLQSISDGVIPAESGIWTLGMPKFWEPLEKANLVSERLLAVLKSSDEINTLEMMGGSVQEMTSRLIGELRNELQQNQVQGTWGTTWHIDNQETV